MQKSILYAKIAISQKQFFSKFSFNKNNKFLYCRQLSIYTYKKKHLKYKHIYINNAFH